MSCTWVDVKAYFLGELAASEKSSLEGHLHGCQSCREELERLNLTRTALLSLEDEDVPQRIAFVSDKVFEPRWWQTMWSKSRKCWTRPKKGSSRNAEATWRWCSKRRGFMSSRLPG